MFDQFQYRFELSSLKVLIPLLYFPDTFTRTSKSLKNSTQLVYLQKTNKELNSSLFSFSIVSHHLEILLEFFSFLLKKKKKKNHKLFIHPFKYPLPPPSPKKKETISNTREIQQYLSTKEEGGGRRNGSTAGEVAYAARSADARV